MEQSELVDKIYEAALIPEKWENVAGLINTVIGTRGGVIFTQSEFRTSFIATPEGAEYFQRFVDEGWDRFNTRRERANRLAHAGFLTDLDVFEEQEIANEPLYRDFLYPIGLGWSVGTHITTPDGDTIAASFDGNFSSGPISRDKVDWLDAIRPHLARALSMTARFHLQTANNIAEGLGAVGLASCVLNAHGKIITANKLMHTVVPTVVLDRRDGLALRHKSSDGLLKSALGKMSAIGGTSEVMSIPVPAFEDDEACIVHIIPIRREGRDLFPSGLFILAISRLASAAVPDAAILRGLFDLTPAEAKVARFAAGGVAPKDIGALSGMKLNTVKVHLKAIYAKTGIDHHSALVRLLSGMPMPRDGM